MLQRLFFLNCFAITFALSGSYFTWIEYDFDEELSSSCMITDSNNDLWLCGGKSPSDNSYSSCRLISINPSTYTTSGYESIGSRVPVYQSSFFPGFYYSSDPFYCESDNLGGISSINSNSGCWINLDDGTNDAKCLCCDINIDTTNDNTQLECTDLSLYNQCKDIFQSCIIYDTNKFISTTHNTIIQIGGLSGTNFNNEISCFDVDLETFEDSSTTTSSDTHESECNFSNLKYGTWQSGCTLINNKLIIVGGESSEKDDYMNIIQICENNSNLDECIESNQYLDIGIEHPRVINLDECQIAIMGGKYALNEYSKNITIYDTCDDQIVGYDLLPIPLSEFNIYNGNGYICTIGGTTNGGTFVDKIYCSLWHYTPAPIVTPQPTDRPSSDPTPRPTTRDPTPSPTPSPSAKPTTPHPTDRPTTPPTDAPTTAPTDYIELDDWYEIYEWSSSRSAQACVSQQSQHLDDGALNSMYIFGGIVWTSSSSQDYSNLFYKIDQNNDDIDVLEYSAYQYNTRFGITSTMEQFYCKHQCSGYYYGYDNTNQDIVSKMYLVSSIGSDANQIHFWECIINDDEQEIICTDICADSVNYDIGTICEDIYFEPCVTYHDEYLYIVGGGYGTSIYDTILVWNMKTNEWVDDTDIADYGKLYTSIKSPSCAYYNNTIYVFGGKYTVSSTDIQICRDQSHILLTADKKDTCILASDLSNTIIDDDSDGNDGGNDDDDDDDETTSTQLHVPRYYSQAHTIGKSIIIGCGEINITHATNLIEIYDAQTNEIIIGPSDSETRKECCLMYSDRSLFISGGQTIDYDDTRRRAIRRLNIIDTGIDIEILSSDVTATGVSTIISADYTTHVDTSNPIIDTSDKELWECESIWIHSYDEYWNNEFTILSGAEGDDGYYIWMDEDYNGVYYYPDQFESWIGGGSKWCYNNHGNLESDYWIELGTQSRHATRLYIEITCNDAANVNNNQNNSNETIAGIQKWLFILLVSLSIILFLCFLIIIYLCCTRSKNSKNTPRNGSSNTSSINNRTNQYQIPQIRNVPSSSNVQQPSHSDIIIKKPQTLSSKMLFGNPQDDGWQKEAQYAVDKQNESDSEEIDQNRVKFDNNNNNGTEMLPLSNDVNTPGTNDGNTPINSGLPKLTPQDLFPQQQ